MSSVVPFSSAQALGEQRQLAATAMQVIEDLGDQAGYYVGVLARSPRLDETARCRLLAIADEIERRQGFGWYFADDMQSA